MTSSDRSARDVGLLFHVVLHEPEIPNNTGNIGRTCVATRCGLHLIHPLGFELSEKACRRAGLDYWPRLCVREHADWEAYLSNERVPRERLWVFTTRTQRCVFDATFELGDSFVFGKESAGLPRDLLDAYADRCVSFPMASGERSVNLASVVSAAVYEGIRQLRVRNLIGQGRELSG
ncbi:MAG: tRNA (cytidine(34)-2'-O)-methyltransferase [Leptolyngbya sp. PLA3]|nr:MAG: tRNA (cytidine(34)-2'-O)-methyltransferase [Cyanobacteria bacterium CYA]MCE7969854.1 tRNA (cytidine(34)-2'-O)-methyltransferase [Leptolyngbya sp. PL-A3]